MNYLEVSGKVADFDLQITVVPDGEVSFTVNKSYLFVGCSPREGAVIIREAIKMWRELLLEVPPDLQLWCRPSEGDDRYKSRVLVYEKLGFSQEEGSFRMILKNPPTFKWSPTPRERAEKPPKRGRRGHAHRFRRL